jgi:hypothetical protein
MVLNFQTPSEMASGTYFAWGKVAKLPQQAQDAGVRRAVWQLLEQLTST